MTEQEAIEVIKNAKEESIKILQELKKVKDKAKKAERVGEYYSHLENCEKEIEACDIAIKALEEIQQYREMEQKLQKIYGENNGLLGMIVNQLYKHEGVDIPESVFKSRLLTDGEVDRWEQYKAIGTVDECREAREKQMALKPEKVLLLYGKKGYECMNCGNELFVNSFGGEYCHWCGQKLDWSDENEQ